MRSLLSIIAIAACCSANAQFAPQAGVTGSTAIAASSSLFTGWASTCNVQRGYMDIANPSAGYVNAGEPANATGMCDGTIVSLGDSGIAVLTFAGHLYDGAGPDFAVFENGFKDPADGSMAFLELAFVEVSSDGINYFRFPATSNTPVSPQIPVAGVYMNASLINNLAGKYVGGYGTPFDLSELAGKPGLDVNNITHVRIIDVIGATGAHASTDFEGHAINDPYPTNIPTGGFDLEAVGAINMVSTGVAGVSNSIQAGIYPNPATDKINITLSSTEAARCELIMTSVTGSVLQHIDVTGTTTTIDIAQYPAGMYYLTVNDDKGNRWAGKVVKY